MLGILNGECKFLVQCNVLVAVKSIFLKLSLAACGKKGLLGILNGECKFLVQYKILVTIRSKCNVLGLHSLHAERLVSWAS